MRLIATLQQRYVSQLDKELYDLKSDLASVQAIGYFTFDSKLIKFIEPATAEKINAFIIEDVKKAIQQLETALDDAEKQYGELPYLLSNPGRSAKEQDKPLL